MRARFTVTTLLFAAAAAWIGLSAQWGTPPAAAPPATFPHAAHEGLIDGDCASCHGTIAQPGGAAFSITAAKCATCHDGDTMPRVEWSPPPVRKGLLKFDHALHVGDQGIDCASCHENPSGAGAMDVRRVNQEACWDCHESAAHYNADNDCASCHVPLVQATGMSKEWVDDLPRPESHADPQFLHDHGVEARADLDDCATCHAQESCTRCHFNVPRVPEIGGLGSDPRVKELADAKSGYWPIPDTHIPGEWVYTHAQTSLESTQRCSNCHAQSSCTSCHAQAVPEAVLDLPIPMEDEPQGVQLPHAPPPGHPPGFATEHGVSAAGGNMKCQACHTPSQCEDCHNAQIAPGFHASNYVLRHGADAFAQDPDCASCHSHEVFCRSCHIQGGMSSADSRTSSFHDAQPMWLLNHGAAARQGMDTCASCHQQRDCLECHSARTGWRINPHGSGFDADDLWDKTPQMCASCHFGEPGR